MIGAMTVLGWALLPAVGGDGLTYTQEKINEKTCDVVGWTDANGKKRSVALVRADGDVHGFKGGYIERYGYFVGDREHVGLSWNQAQESVSGLGCAVSHHKGASCSKSAASAATTEFIRKGEHHCLWRFKGDFKGMGKTLDLVIDYSISTGRNDVLWSVSYDCSKLADNEIKWDARGPYVQFDWDGDGKFYDGRISGIRWGDRYKFKTLNYVFGSPEQTTWDYSQPNVIPHMLLWKDASLGDVELGMVQTQPWEIQDAGGYWWSENWKKTGTGLPTDWKCPFQLNAYEKYSSEKMAWGANFGFVGSSSYEVLGGARKASGWPQQGYAVQIVLNRASEALTDKTLASMEAVQKTKLTASAGSVAARGPRHAGLEAEGEYRPAGWNHVHGRWMLSAGADASVTANVDIASGALYRPIFEVSNYGAKAAPASLRLNGKPLSAGTDFVASIDPGRKSLILTLLRDLAGEKNELAIVPPK